MPKQRVRAGLARRPLSGRAQTREQGGEHDGAELPDQCQDIRVEPFRRRRGPVRRVEEVAQGGEAGGR